MEQMGGNQLTFEAIMTPNFLYFVITLAVIGYLYQTKMVLSRENQVKLQSANLFDKQLYLEIGFMILIGLSMYILNNGENTTFIWLYMLIPIVYLVLKSLIDLKNLKESNSSIKALAYQLYENNGVIKREVVAEYLKKLGQGERKILRDLGVKFGRYHVFLFRLLKPEAVSLRTLLWKNYKQ